jgi:hypothetical protein
MTKTKFTKDFIEQIQQSLHEDKSFRNELMTIYTPSEITYFENYKYVSRKEKFLKVCTKINYSLHCFWEFLVDNPMIFISLSVIFLFLGIYWLFKYISLKDAEGLIKR